MPRNGISDRLHPWSSFFFGDKRIPVPGQAAKSVSNFNKPLQSWTEAHSWQNEVWTKTMLQMDTQMDTQMDAKELEENQGILNDPETSCQVKVGWNMLKLRQLQVQMESKKSQVESWNILKSHMSHEDFGSLSLQRVSPYSCSPMLKATAANLRPPGHERRFCLHPMPQHPMPRCPRDCVVTSVRYGKNTCEQMQTTS